MAEPLPDLDTDLSGLSRADWWAQIDQIGEAQGYHLTVGDRHTALFIDAGPKLLVTFEEASSVRKLPGARPRGFDLAQRHGWSLLTILARRATWFRDPALYSFFDRQVDDGFFDEFDQVTFFGHQMGGYAAAAYSVAAPAAHVVVVSPVATLAPRIAGWDRRHTDARRLDFTSRYGFAPDMIEAASAAWVVFDPGYAPDAMHAALFRRPNVQGLRAPHSQGKLAAFLDHLSLTAPLIESAMAGDLSAAEFGRIWRRRRRSPAYVRGLLARAEAEGRAGLVTRICRYGLKTRDAAIYRDRLRRIGANTTAHPAQG